MWHDLETVSRPEHARVQKVERRVIRNVTVEGSRSQGQRDRGRLKELWLYRWEEGK